MDAGAAFDEDVYDNDGEVEYDEEYDSHDDGYLEEVPVEDDAGEVEIIEGDEADDEDDAAGAGPNGEAGGQGQMLYIPGLGYIPLSSLGNIPGLTMGRQGGAAPQGAAAAPAPETEKDWAALEEFPEVTKESIEDYISNLGEDGKHDLTVLVLGKGGAGKSSTINSLLNERVANVLAFQQDNAKPTMFSRRARGFTLNLIDTPSVLDQDAVSDARLEAIARMLKDRPIDVVLYVDRLDSYAMDALDQALIEGITRVLGPEIWQVALLGFTRASKGAQPHGVEFKDFVAERSSQLRTAIQKCSGNAVEFEIPVVLIENSSQCEVNADGEKIVPKADDDSAYEELGELESFAATGIPWISELYAKAFEIPMNMEPFEYNPDKANKVSDPNRKRRWLIPLVIALQVGLKLLLDRVLDDDGCRGDSNGPFDAQTVKERRAELKAEKEKAKRRRQKQRSVPSAPSAGSAQNQNQYYDDLEDGLSLDDEDDYED